MLSTNIDEVIKDLEEKVKQIESKLTGMVKSFIYEITVEAINITPYGSEEYISTDGEILPNRLYNIKARETYFLRPQPGHAKGGWLYSFGYLPPRKPVGTPAESMDAMDIKADRQRDISAYKLGQTVYLFNAVPYVATEGFTMPGMGSLEGGYSKQAPGGISAPLESAIESIYSQNLVSYYKDAE